MEIITVWLANLFNIADIPHKQLAFRTQEEAKRVNETCQEAEAVLLDDGNIRLLSPFVNPLYEDANDVIKRLALAKLSDDERAVLGLEPATSLVLNKPNA